jgi:hypothetical protein
MLKKVIWVVVALAIVLGIRHALESQAERMLGVAQEMYEDDELEMALGKVRDLETFFGWTDAFERSEQLREDIRKAKNRRRQKEENDRRWEKIDKEQRARQEREEEHQRQMELRKQQHEQQRERLLLQPTPTPRPWERRL